MQLCHTTAFKEIILLVFIFCFTIFVSYSFRFYCQNKILSKCKKLWSPRPCSTLREKIPSSEFFWSVFSRILTEICSLYIGIQYKCGKMQTRKSANMKTFYAVVSFLLYLFCFLMFYFFSVMKKCVSCGSCMILFLKSN